MSLLKFVLVTGVLVGTLSPSYSQSEKQSVAEDPITEVRMRRFGCTPGICPTDELVLRADKTAFYIGKVAVKPLGISRGYLPDFEFKSLVDFLKIQKFFEQKDTPPTGPGGGEGVMVTVTRSGQPYFLRIRDTGSPPPSLWGIMMSIRGVAADIEWAKNEGGLRGIVTGLPQTPAATTLEGKTLPRAFVSARRYETEKELLRAPVDELGKFELNLPPGDYFVAPEYIDPSRRFVIGEITKLTVPKVGVAEVTLAYKSRAR
jgi:hypothetical protein